MKAIQLKSMGIRGSELKSGVVVRGLYETFGSKLKIEVQYNKTFNTYGLYISRPYDLTGDWMCIKHEKLSRDATMGEVRDRTTLLLRSLGF